MADKRGDLVQGSSNRTQARCLWPFNVYSGTDCRSEWKATENSRRAKYYTFTQQGRKKLSSETREWGRQVAAIARILEA